MKRTAVESFLSGLPSIRALVVGDLMLDEYLWGNADRISPEAPVQVVDVKRHDLRLGGAGNVINNLLRLGCQVDVASVLGEDEDGKLLRRRLQELQVGIDGVQQVPGRTTSRKTRVLASNQQMLRIDRESCEAILGMQEDALVAYIRRQMNHVDVVLLSDYLKGVLTPLVLREIIDAGRQAGIPVVVDPKGSDYSKYKGATLLTPNRKEAQLASQIEITDDATLRVAGRKLCRELDLDVLVLTRSEEGMSLFKRNGTEVDLPTEAREVYDVSGAGDTVLCLFGVGLAGGLSLEDTAYLANVAAGVVVGKVGTSTVSPHEILEVVEGQHLDTDRKIKSRCLISAEMQQARERGRTIVFTNGCFDLLHVGHVKYLQKARRLGDLLVLGLNSDTSIRRLKGAKRPFIDQEERAHILAALDCVDYVVIFDEDTPLELIREVRPHILVKGGDYQPDQVVGKEIVESYGGHVELITFVDGKSTTNIVEKILQAYQE
ncbi:bifunctional D-glycero-beta-D-manno-heptose-7-phosphate kinase/D-glycero-beta-D-manno-heptose 1-phosphate adenylyltransferase HldE [Desulfuromonas sp. AOP6]|uniref:bifunctional D-glycero-beta-D-manno-heptose-7-phosphate kinase/D-glycero-beta-D-manno-heptose 1-phosphate adenylyltransferase HldE n=1 Tax=Desulfuromonas sp. AOP6 TaxID=1566351 RepID=UPI00127E23BD|nr:bifunctional D-glycero-beta-D-manno-heptose-7-phosphate kinase/D-glycero-beta-D-manno-heptose 1-phosphate adenylyltransferase HldE [Desulfuromonas sp. AOP6]BCA80106.1 bifunctional protein HldE [Desulfuromonas sp. AOP6]